MAQDIYGRAKFGYLTYDDMLIKIQDNILDAYDTLDPEEQSAFWHGLIKAIYIDDDYNITSIDFF